MILGLSAIITLSILFISQPSFLIKSLTFDSNNKLAINLFQIYEYCRQQLIKGYSKKVVKDIIKAANAIKNILSSFEEGLSNA